MHIPAPHPWIWVAVIGSLQWAYIIKGLALL